MVVAAKKAGVKRFVYCSSSSVYGVSDSPDVTEEHPLVPLTLYNKFKGMCEPLLWKHKSDDFTCVVIRPATVCGYSPRTRLDLSVNILTNHAVNKGKITVFGGKQMRPNLHIEDMVDAYELMLEAPHEKIARRDLQYRLPEPFDRRDRQHGEAAWSRRNSRRRARSRSSPRRPTTSAPITSIPTRCARVLGFRPKRTIEDAVRDLARAFRNHLLPNSFDDDWYYNVRTMKKIGAK